MRRRLGLGERDECPACKDVAESLGLGEKNSHTLFECRRCGAVFPRPWPARAVTEDLYNRYYEQAGFAATPTAMSSLERLVEYAETFRKTGRWLDMGYGEGALLAVANRRGWGCYGVEVSERVLEYGRGRGWTVTSEPQSDPRFVAGDFDVVTMIELLEHVTVPTRFLNDAACWLRPGGLLYITTPNIRGLNGRILGLNWSVVSPPEHIVLWTVPALCSAVEKCGFRVLRMRTEGLNPTEILALARWRNKEKPVDRNKSAVALSGAMSRTRARRALKTAINEGLNVFWLGDTLKMWARRVG
jgi:2-polyprenyl-3-methyl-5-hydroxy-6-metoxy-1,4-benzoquinol methylase